MDHGVKDTHPADRPADATTSSGAETTRPGMMLHGGDLAAARARFPRAPEPWIDLSTGINPHAFPVGALPDEVWRRLPASADVARLEAAARAAYSAEARSTVIAAPGTQALIQVLPRLLPARRVAVLDFGYGEHPASWKAVGAAVSIVRDTWDLADADVAVVVNPNNPDGRIVAPKTLVTMAERLSRRGGTLVVDEAFVDACDPDLSLVPHFPDRGAIVLRSFGKIFGLAGLRLGFAVVPDSLAPAFRRALGPWAVSGPALSIGTAALTDAAWLDATRVRLRHDAGRLDALLADAGLTIRGGTALFRLAEHPRADDLYDRLGRAGILVRPFPQRPTWLRFGLPADSSAWTRLAVVLKP